MKQKTTRLLAAAVIICSATYVDAASVNWNSIQVDEMEYYIQTDKPVYMLGEDVHMLYRITNWGQQSVTCMAYRSPIWNFWVESNGQSIWSGITTWLGAATWLTIEPGESIEFPDYCLTWGLKDDTGAFVQPGCYDLIGGIDHPQHDYDYTRVSVPIQVVPEPATFLLLVIGGLLFSRATVFQRAACA